MWKHTLRHSPAMQLLLSLLLRCAAATAAKGLQKHKPHQQSAITLLCNDNERPLLLVATTAAAAARILCLASLTPQAACLWLRLCSCCYSMVCKPQLVLLCLQLLQAQTGFTYLGHLRCCKQTP